MCVDNALRSKSKRHASIISTPSSSSLSSATIVVAGPSSRSRRKCSVNIRAILFLLVLGTAASVFISWEIMSTMLHWSALDPVEQYHTSTYGDGDINSFYSNNVSGDSSSISISYGGSKHMPKIDAKEAMLPGHVKLLPLYTRDMASDAVRPAPWACGSRRNDHDSTDHSDGKDDVKSSATPSSSIGEERHIFSFVHVYKSAGSTIRTFFRQYSDICQKSWMLLVSCNDRRNASPQSLISIRALEDGNGKGVYWKGCKIKEMDIRPKELVNENSTLEDSIDIFGGHFRIGIVGSADNETTSGDGCGASSYYPCDHPASTKQQSSHLPSPTVVVRHIVFLRDPMARFVSGILYQHQQAAQFDGTLDGAVKRIKKNVRGSRKNQEYWTRSSKYLLTASQASYFAMMRKAIIMGDNNNTTTREEKMNSLADIESQTAIRNLVEYNVIVGLAEQMDQSMTILQHVLVPATGYNKDTAAVAAGNVSSQGWHDKIDALFNVFGGPSMTGVVPGEDDVVSDKERDLLKEDVRMNSSTQEGVSTKAVMEELMKDLSFQPLFKEYVKYEQRIHDFAIKMHEMQYREAVRV